MYRNFFIAGLIALLSACGGGTGGVGPSVSQVKALSLKYGQTAAIYVVGKYLRTDMVAETGTCANPSFSALSTTEAAILNCRITVTGPMPISIKDADGVVLFTTTLTVMQPQVTLVTSEGSLVMELYPDVVPGTVNNFLSYVNKGFYATTIFHRVIAGFVIQAGGYTKGVVTREGQTAPIVLESNKGLSNTRGSVAMARASEANSATSQFFINLVDNPFLDFASAASPGYAVFGKVLSGLAVVDAIAGKPTGASAGLVDVPLADVTILSATQTQ